MKNIALEWKYRETRLSRANVDTYVGNTIRNGLIKVGNPKSGCVIIKCHSVAGTAYTAATEWKEKGVNVKIDPCLGGKYDNKYKGIT